MAGATPEHHALRQRESMTLRGKKQTSRPHLNLPLYTEVKPTERAFCDRNDLCRAGETGVA